MKILCGSDFHGRERAYRGFAEALRGSGADLGLIAGDLTGFSLSPGKEEERLRGILDGADRDILFVMGNDDRAEWRSEGRLLNIHARRESIGGMGFVGYQFTNPFIGGKFEKAEEGQERDFASLEGLASGDYILLTHGPAFGVLDAVGSGKKVGSAALRRFIQRTKPAYHVFGHIHESHGKAGNAINASYPLGKAFWLIDLEGGSAELIPA